MFFEQKPGKTVQKWLETRFINSALIVSKLSVFSVRANKKAITAGGWTETERQKSHYCPRYV